MASNKRISRLPVTNLVEQSDRCKDSLTRLLDLDKCQIASTSELREIAHAIKSTYRDYCSITHDAIFII